VLPSISAEFKQLREALGFSNTFVKESFVPQSLLRAILSPNSEENQQSDSEKNRLPSRTRKYLRWILLVMEPNLDAENLTNPELVSKALRHVSREFLRFMEPENLPADGWREAQWQRLLDYCRDPQQHEDLKQRFFSIQHPDGTTQLEQERFNEWWERFNSR
jgi:hypothetical protein